MALPYPFTRDLPVEPAHTTLLFIDVQNYCARRDGSEFKDLPPAEFQAKLGWFFDRFEAETLPNMQRLQDGCRRAVIEVMYTVIRNLTADGRDRSLDKNKGALARSPTPPGTLIGPGEDSQVKLRTVNDLVVRHRRSRRCLRRSRR